MAKNQLSPLSEDVTQRSESAIKNALEKDVDDEIFSKIAAECGGDIELANRIRPFAHLLRTDAWGDFIVYHANSFAVALGADRRETGTHYTPKSLDRKYRRNDARTDCLCRPGRRQTTQRMATQVIRRIAGFENL